MKNTMWNFKQYENNIALLTDEGEKLTYADLEQESEQLFDIIGNRCLIFSLCSNTIGSVIGYVACIQHGAVPVLLNAHMDESLMDGLLQSYCPKYLWLPENISKRYSDFDTIYRKYEYVLLKTNFQTEFPLYEELGLLLTTSGSTGSPKFVRQTYENVRVNAEQIVEYLELSAIERPVTTLPMNYTYGCSIINTHLMVGATILLTEKSFMNREFWSFIKEQKATSIAGVPYTYEMLDKLQFFRRDLPDLQTMTQAGGKLSPELHEKFARYAFMHRKKFVVMYGACEATARMGYLPYAKALEKKGSCGIAIPRGKFYLMDDSNQIISEPYKTGELVYEGPNVTMGYAECGEDLIKGDERHGRLLTGDMAQRDEDGFYYIVGRKKRFLKIYGNRVNLDEIDRMIKAEFDFADCASAGLDDHMYIFVTDGSIVEMVRKYISEKTGLNQAAFRVIQIDEIPKNDAGKILYKELATYYE